MGGTETEEQGQRSAEEEQEQGNHKEHKEHKGDQGGFVADPLSRRVIGAAIEVHRALGPGLLESTYEACLVHELGLRGIPFRRQVEVPVVYKGVLVDSAFRADVIVDQLLILELKAVEKVLPIHLAQLMTYMKLCRIRVGLLLNFNSHSMIDGITRRVL
jgi:GxxExxY protein